jgi:cytoskeletal protein RodZ
MNPVTEPTLPSSGPRRWRLAYHLIIVLVVKLILLALLWNIFIKPNKVVVDVDMMSDRIAGAASAANTPSVYIPTSPGDNK